MKSKGTILLFIILSVIAISFLTVKTDRSPRMAQIGGAPQDFEVVGMNKEGLRLSAMKGSVVFVNFWATWCESCVDELPSIERLFRTLSGNSSFKMVTILYKDDGQQALAYMQQHGYTFPIYLNPDESAARIFGITGVPETFIIDKKGVLRDKVIGPAAWDSPQAVASLQALMNEL